MVPNRIGIGGEAAEDYRSGPLRILDQPQKDVLRSDIVVPKSDRLFPRVRENLPGLIGEIVVHGEERGG